ncbi:translation machinery-associated protein 16-like [Tropilaelaps mercedesae]|uniref:Translation machinery-associated protein 16-like n=1 Tax=Tropilaelaps mercedesae TaxID=418985 RepID=A0A1V9XK13_9ACAR|nr:translation machinery-associated protein 16-like [Tropilaelaps mercedesae]
MSKAAMKRKAQNHRKKDLHPNSRKVKQLARKQLHNIKVRQRKTEYSQRNRMKMEKFQYFFKCLPEGVTRLGGAEVKYIINGYFSRFDNEITEAERLFKMRGNASQHAGRMDAIKMTLDLEKQEFESAAFEIPDVLSTEGFRLFRAWDLKESYLPKIKTRLVSPEVLSRLN